MLTSKVMQTLRTPIGQEQPDGHESGRASLRPQRGRACASDSCAVKQPIPSRAQSRQSTLRLSTAKISAAPAAFDPEVARPPTRALNLLLPILPTSPAPSLVCNSF